MKVSEITNKNLADYLILEYADLTENEKLNLDVLLDIAIAFIKGYTGLKDLTVTGESIGIGDGETKTFYLDNDNVYTDSQSIYVDGIVTEDYTLDFATGKIDFLVAPTLELAITADYKASQIDKFEDFVIVVYVLVQDMHDNRTLYVDKSNMNKVVDTILGMHSVNLL